MHPGVRQAIEARAKIVQPHGSLLFDASGLQTANALAAFIPCPPTDLQHALAATCIMSEFGNVQQSTVAQSYIVDEVGLNLFGPQSNFYQKRPGPSNEYYMEDLELWRWVETTAKFFTGEWTIASQRPMRWGEWSWSGSSRPTAPRAPWTISFLVLEPALRRKYSADVSVSGKARRDLTIDGSRIAQGKDVKLGTLLKRACSEGDTTSDLLRLCILSLQSRAIDPAAEPNLKEFARLRHDKAHAAAEDNAGSFAYLACALIILLQIEPNYPASAAPGISFL